MNDTAYFDYASTDAHKLLSDNRALYIEQSANTVAGRVAPFPSNPSTTAPVATLSVPDSGGLLLLPSPSAVSHNHNVDSAAGGLLYPVSA